MKKAFNKRIPILLIVVLTAATFLTLTVEAQGNNNPNKLHGSPVFVLNILGKKI